MKRLTLLTVLILSVTLLLSGCFSSKNTGSSGTTGDGDHISVVVGPNPDTLDPAINSTADGATIILHVFEGLMSLDENGVPILGQAASYTVNEDDTVYTFKLRDDLKWSDGKPITASDFVYTWNRVIDPATAADYSYMFDVIERLDDGSLAVSATDDSTLVVELRTPSTYFLELCAFPAYFPVRKDIIEEYGERWSIKGETYMGNGPYKIKEYLSGVHILLEKNEYYWNYEALGPETIKFLLIEDDNAQLAAFQNGEVQLIGRIPNNEIDAWVEKPEYHISTQLGTYYISFNTAKAPLNDARVREALSLAIDREYITDKVTKSGQVPAGAFVPIGLSDADPEVDFRDVGGEYIDSSSSSYEKNLARAKELLVEAGYPDGKGLPTMEYLYNESSIHQQIGEALQDMWKKIGVNVNLVQQEWSTFLNTRKNGDFYIARNGWLADYNDPITFLDLFVTDGGNNDGQFSNKEYDDLISKARLSKIKEERYELMHEAEQIIFDNSIIAPIHYYVEVNLVSQKLKGYYSSPLGYKYFMYCTLEE